ncbi:MAG: serine/threonine protein kinase [Desmonostoc vinosum HA7617-LM4]|jgi:serine/threonine-protein kinase|nr:serine/threonine protein kinase [Desmonostoc vinosum HA7617-LM4]
MIGKLLDGRYQVLQILGAGGFGQTYIAQDTRRPGFPKCVVKHLKPISDTPEFLETGRRLFTSEAETLEQLGNHDQIPRLLAYFEQDNQFFLVQEFIEGHTLKAELLPGQRWSEEQVMQLLQQILSILSFIHNHKVIHRDIKPENIIRRQQDGRFVLIDFGAVKQIQTQLLTVMGHTQTTIIIGTPGYMSTEQGQGKPRPNSDIYSLGIIGIQALTGLHPNDFEEDVDTGEISWQHRTQVSPLLADVLSKMVLHHFKQRYQTAAEALQALLGTQETLIEKPSTQPQSVAQSQQHVEHSAVFTLSSETHNRLEKILLEFIGPVAPRLLKQVAPSASNPEELISKLQVHLTENQKIDFRKKTIFLIEKPTVLQEITIKSETKSANLSSQDNQLITDSFISQCERELTILIGPIATFLVKKALKTSPQISRIDLVKILASQIPDPQKAIQFKQQLSGE